MCKTYIDIVNILKGKINVTWQLQLNKDFVTLIVIDSGDFDELKVTIKA